jgi:hypothetical protein
MFRERKALACLADREDSRLELPGSGARPLLYVMADACADLYRRHGAAAGIRELT